MAELSEARTLGYNNLKLHKLHNYHNCFLEAQCQVWHTLSAENFSWSLHQQMTKGQIFSPSLTIKASHQLHENEIEMKIHWTGNCLGKFEFASCSEKTANQYSNIAKLHAQKHLVGLEHSRFWSP